MPTGQVPKQSPVCESFFTSLLSMIFPKAFVLLGSQTRKRAGLLEMG